MTQSRARPVIPNQDSSLSSRIGWSIVSKAAERSSRVSAVTLPLSMAVMMSLWIFSSAVSVEWSFLYADCHVDVGLKPTGNDLFENFGYETQVGYWSVVLHIIFQKGGFFQQWCHVSLFE